MSPSRTLTSGQLAARYDVHPKTPARWARDGKLGPYGGLWFRTPGGQMRVWLDKLEEREREGWRPA